MVTLILVVLGAFVGMVLQEGDALGFAVGGLCAYLLRQTFVTRKVEAELRESIRAANEQLWELRHTTDAVLDPGAAVLDPGDAVLDPGDAVLDPKSGQEDPEVSEGASEPPTYPDRKQQPQPQPVRPQVSLVAFVSNAVSAFFTEGTSIVRVGMLVLLVGVALLGKYAVDRDLIPIETRLMSAGALGMGLLIFGYQRRHKRPDVALVLQGGGLGAMYITVFFSMKTYEVLPLTVGFALLVVLTSVGILAAALQNALSLAVYSVLGGFLAPVISSSGGNHFVFLFSYYTVLNLGILGTGWLKNWRALNLLGFVLTFGVASAWGGLKYEPAFYPDVQPFLIIFFLIYWLLPIFYAEGRSAPNGSRDSWAGRVDSTLIFGAPLAAFALQHQLLEDSRYGVAISCASVAVTYLASAGYALRKAKGALLHLGESHLALAVTFATLAIPFTLSDGRFTGGLWALEGAGAYWVGARQDRKLPRFAGMILQGLAAGAFLQADGPAVPEGLLNGAAVAQALIALGGLLVAWIAFRLRDASTRVGGDAPVQLFFVWACLWWGSALREELSGALGAFEAHAFWFIACTLSVFGSFYFGRRQRWFLPQSVALWALVPVVVSVVFYAKHYESPLAGNALTIGGGVAGYVAWPLWVAGYLLLLKIKSEQLQPQATPWFHGVWASLLTGLVTWEIVYRINKQAPDADNWIICALLLVPACFSVGIHIGRNLRRFPVRVAPVGYVGTQTLIAVLHGLGFLLVLFADSKMAPLPYLPLLNPVDAAQGAVMFAWFFCLKDLGALYTRDGRKSRALSKWLLASAAVLWANSVVARSVSAYGGVPYQLDALLDSQVMQMSLTMFWTTVGLTLVLAAHRKQRRNLWWLGAAILGLVILKLFGVDLAKIGTLLRTITFLAVGMLLVLVGYKAPLPTPISGGRAKEGGE